MKQIVGVLGGMGPLATVDFLRKIVEETPASCDQEHIPLVIYSVPQIPDRSHSIIADGESPLPMLLRGAKTLQDSGAAFIAIPCNTAHYWHQALAAGLDIPVLHIADCVCAQIRRMNSGSAPIGVLATAGTLQAGFYREKLEADGHPMLCPPADEQADLVGHGIQLVKQGKILEGGRLLDAALEHLLARGAGTVILACTEIPLGLAAIASQRQSRTIDATLSLARACVQRATAAA